MHVLTQEEESRHHAVKRVQHHAEELLDANTRQEKRGLSAADPRTPSVFVVVEAVADAACAEVKDSECFAELNQGKPPTLKII